MEQKLETGVMLSPKCQQCPNRYSCNGKEFCAYLIPPKEIEGGWISSIEETLLVPILTPGELTPEMFQKEIFKQLCERNMKSDNASLMGLRK